MHSTSNVVSLHKARESGAAETQSKQNTSGIQEEQRAEPRDHSGERLFVQITQAGDKDLVGSTLSCKTVYSSANGIKFLTTEFIPVGSLVDLWVDEQARPGKFFLSGDVRWTQKVGHTSTIVGVRLQDGLATDIENWKEVHPS